MLELTPDQFYKRIIADGIKVVNFYEGSVINPKDQRFVFQRIKDEDAGQVAAQCRDLLEQFPAVFTVTCTHQINGGNLPPLCFRVRSAKAGAQQLQGVPQVDEAKIYNSILARIRGEMEQEALKRENAYLRQRLQGFENGGEKTAFVLGKVVEHLLKKNPKVAAVMNGYENEKNMSANAETTQEKKPIQDREKVSQALETLLDLFGEEKLITIAETLKADENKVNLIKAYI